MFEEELGFTLDLSFPHPKCRDNTDGADVPRDKIKRLLKKAAMEQRKTEVKEKRRQGKLNNLTENSRKTAESIPHVLGSCFALA